MNIQTIVSTSSNLFEQFLAVNGKIDLTEFYNFVLQKFFDDCDFGQMVQRSTSIVLAHEFPNGVFTITLEVKLNKTAETLYFPNRRDRSILYRLLFETGSYSRPEKIPPVFTFKSSPELRAMFSEWLRKLSQISAHIDAAFTSNGHDNSQNTRRSAVLQFVNDYEIGEKDAGDRCIVKIEFADWIRRGFNEQFLDQGIMPLLTQSKIFDGSKVSAC